MIHERPGPRTMVTEPEAFFQIFKRELVGHKVTFSRLACDCLLLYIDGHPGDANGITFWFDSIWHLRGPEGVLLGSLQFAEASDSEEAMAAVADGPMAPLIGTLVESIAIDPTTFDLSVSFECDCVVCTFAADATADESWHIRENATGTRLKGSPRGLVVESK